MTKNNISAVVVADSKNEFGNRITTMIVTMPRYILAEFNTHRMFSRNSASSRAIPFEKMIKSIEDNPFIPIAWMKDHKGMQGTEYIIDVNHIDTCEADWLEARDLAINQAQKLNEGFPVKDTDILTEVNPKDLCDSVTKQLCNRLLEPFMYHTVIVTATEYENFFALRCPQYTFDGSKLYRSRKDATIDIWGKEHPNNPADEIDNLGWLKLNKGQADIHMMATAEAMWDAYNESTPKELKAGEWHIPFGDNIKDTESPYYETFFNPSASIEMKNGGTYGEALEKIRVKIATARCARVSYTVVGEEGKPANYENDIKLHDRLAASGHWSCFEHCARTMNQGEWTKSYISTPLEDGVHSYMHDAGASGNFRGFVQYRKMFEKENIT